MLSGEFVHGEMSGDANTAAVVFTMYNQELVARTLGATEYLVLTSVSLVSSATQTVRIYQGTGASPAAGEMIIGGDFAANGGINQQYLNEGFWMKKGITPKIFASTTGSVRAFFTGFIRRA